MNIIPLGGLCNYLRVIFYYYEIAKSKNIKLNVIYYYNENGEICDNLFKYFEIPNNMNVFITKKINFINNFKNITYKGYGYSN